LNLNNWGKYIFLVGTPRSGGTVLTQSFDGHPNILVWPWEFFYFDWFNQIADGRTLVPNSELNDSFERMFINNFSKTLQDTSKYLDKDNFSIEDMNYGTFSYSKLITMIKSEKPKNILPIEYLTFLFKCLKKSDSRYCNRSVKYFLVHTTARGFNWKDESLIKSSQLIFHYRKLDEVYTSLKKKYEKISFYYLNHFSIKYKKSMIYWFESFNQIDRLGQRHINRNNFYLSHLKDLQENPDKSINNICNQLKVNPHPSNFTLTVCGKKTYGHGKRDSKLGKILFSDKPYKLLMFSFEKKLFNSINHYDFENMKMSTPIKFNFIQMIISAIKTSFIEIPRKKISLKSNNSILYNYKGRLTIFFNLIKIYFIYKNESKPLEILKENNYLVYPKSLFWE